MSQQIMVAPWVQYPELPHGSLGWRMGYGEAYLDDFLEWMYEQDKNVIDQFFRQYPVPEEWNSFFDYHLEKMKTQKIPWGV